MNTNTFLDNSFLGNELRQWLFALCFVVGGFLAGKIVPSVFRHLGRKTAFAFDDILFAKINHPLNLIVTIAGIKLGFDLLLLSETAQLWLNRSLSILSIVSLAWMASGALDAFLVQYMPSGSLDPTSNSMTDIKPLARKLCSVVVWIIAFVLILRTLDYDVSALLAGLGLGGAALALASKDTLANCFGSITVFVDRPFRINDRIKIMGYDGFITEMSLRTSRLRTMENRTVIIPNSVFSATPIENISADPSTVNQSIVVKTANGREKIQTAITLLLEIGAGTEGCTGAPTALLVSINGNACQITFTFYVAEAADYIATLNRVNMAILSRFEEAGIALV
ncbi:MAG: mechanosensitive ion channel family protein [Treponema sp.]|jgi:MscS family membrane protein|nr:mechanosensitive ion channel family protein [Treponema sp.]